ncbi:MAG: 50S ribosomal protein L10 [Peptococcaceae bacterium]|nr:50S ribosomal protein L10 [Peptococcaceae bacterium]
MPTKQEKEVILEELRERFRNSRVAVLADNRGINVATMTKLRRRMRDKGCVLKVAKNTLTLKVAREMGLDGLESYLEGPTIIAFSGEDLVAPAKVFTDFIKETKAPIEVKGGVLEGRAIDAKAVRDLADLPSREVLLGKVLGGMQAPLYGFASVLQGTLRSFVYALEAIRRQKAGETA